MFQRTLKSLERRGKRTDEIQKDQHTKKSGQGGEKKLRTQIINFTAVKTFWDQILVAPFSTIPYCLYFNSIIISKYFFNCFYQQIFIFTCVRKRGGEKEKVRKCFTTLGKPSKNKNGQSWESVPTCQTPPPP